MKHLLILLGLAASVLVVLSPSPTAAAPPRPNVVLITVDDMRADDIAHMPRTQRLLEQFELTDFVSNHPVCCPARAELLTGQFGHNNGVHHNNSSSPWGGYKALKAKNNTFGRWFQQGGYTTALIGKFINGWSPSKERRPAGWSNFTPLAGRAYGAYDYSFVAGDRVKKAPAGLHTNDFVTRETNARISKYERRDSRPFLIWSSYVAPHSMTNESGNFRLPIPADRHLGTLDGVAPLSESKPSFEDPTDREQARALYEDADYAPTERQVARAARPSIRENNQARLESLLSVDEGVEQILLRLDELGELERTVVVFTSDNGFLLGEHGEMGKNSYYEESLRVPLLARGPGVAAGDSDKGSMITDIAPSLAAVAGVDIQRAVDGRTDLFALRGGWSDETGVLIQAGSDNRPWWWRGVRTSRYTYANISDERIVMFDRDSDPYQMDNITGRRPAVEEDLARNTPSLSAP